MANECLVTKLKGVVNNPSLPKLGEMTFIANQISSSLFTAARNVLIYYYTEKTRTVKVVSGHAVISASADLSNPTNELTFTGTMISFYLLNHDGNEEIKLEDKYDIRYIQAGYDNKIFDLHDICYSKVTFTDLAVAPSFDHDADNALIVNSSMKDYIETFKVHGYCGSLETLMANCPNLVNLGIGSYNGSQNYLTGDISCLAGKHVWYFSAGGLTQLTGDLAVFNGDGYMQQFYVNSTAVYGNIASFANCAAIKDIYVGNCQGVTGNLEDLCAGLCSLYNNNQIVTVSAGGSSVRFHDAPMDSLVITFNATGCTLSDGSSYNKSTGTWTYAA